ncbi:MAG: ice-binding family protein [Bacteriovorax sp.]
MNRNALNKSLILASILISFGLVATGCGKKASSSSTDQIISETTKHEGPPQANHNVKPLDLGIVESFAVMAYSSITSSPRSNINGKVGLKPGTRNLIALDASSEVEGGSVNIYSGDDIGDKAIYLSLAREDLITAYREAAVRPTDKEKNEQFGGKLGGKTLPPGIYRWSDGVIIDSDMNLEGNSKDVWIFQITGNVLVANGARVRLSDGAKARNVFWQISGKVNLEENSVVSGTMMSQLNFEMKNSAKVNGRALVKNGKLIMNQNVINMPQ